MKIIRSRTGLKHKVEERKSARKIKTACGETFINSPKSEVREGNLRGSEGCKRCKKTL